MTATLSPARPRPVGDGSWRRWSTPQARAVAAIAVIGAAHASAFGYTLSQLGEGVDVTSPVVFVPFVPVVALAVAAQRWRGGPEESDQTAHRAADAVVFVGLAVASLIVARSFPVAFTTETLTWRADLAAVPLTAAAVVVALFGVRMLWRLRTTIWFLSLMSPALYRPIVGAVRSATSTSTNWTVGWGAGLLPFVHGTTDTTGGRHVEVAHGAEVVTLRVAEVCAGNGAVLAGLFVGASMWMLSTGTRQAKAAWVGLCAALCWLGNLARLVAVFAATAVGGAGAATGWFHDLAGAVGLIGALLVALGLTARFGIVPRGAEVADGPAEPTTNAGRPRVATPRMSVLSVGAVVAFAVIGSTSSAAATSRFDLMAGDSRTPARPVAELLRSWSVDGGPGARSVAIGPDVAWAADYFGDGATWKTFFGRGPEDRAPIGVDVIATDEPTTFDTYGLAACFGFHGWRMDHNETIELPGGRRAEQIVYTVRGAAAQRQAETVGGRTRSVAVVSWRQRTTNGRVERITLQQAQPVGGAQLDDLRELAAEIARASSTSAAAGAAESVTS